MFRLWQTLPGQVVTTKYNVFWGNAGENADRNIACSVQSSILIYNNIVDSNLNTTNEFY